MARRRTSGTKPTDRFVRRSRARRRVGLRARCVCGERRPAALIAKSDPMICQRCKRVRDQKKTIDHHHVAGRTNDPTTIAVPTNDHVADLSERQRDWPELTLRNPDGDPFLRAAASVRGCFDTIVYLAERLLLWIPLMLETASAFLTQVLGRFYWRGTPLQAFASGR